MNCVKCNSQGAFLCKCGTRYCGIACQKEHWKTHKAYCSDTMFKVELDKSLKFVIEEWDESKYACFTHFSESDAIAGGYNSARALGEVPDVQLTKGGVMSFMEFDVVAVLIRARLEHSNSVRCRKWQLVLSDDTRRKITTIMIDKPGRKVDQILKIYAPEHAMPGWTVFHFFNHKTAVSVMGPLMCVD
jgi:hypothetical protein